MSIDAAVESAANATELSSWLRCRPLLRSRGPTSSPGPAVWDKRTLSDQVADAPNPPRPMSQLGQYLLRLECQRMSACRLLGTSKLAVWILRPFDRMVW